MTEARMPGLGLASGRLGLAVGLAGAAVMFGLWLLAPERPAWALVAALTLAALTVTLAAITRPRGGGSPPASAMSSTLAAATISPAPDAAALIEGLADPVLLVSGGERSDPNGRRFIMANAAARDLLRIQRAEGPLATALRAPEVLAAVDEALFDGVTGHALYQAGGVQDRVWRVRAQPLATAGRVVLVSLRDETEFRRSERTRADFLANASHELRTPLASLTGFVETLRGHARDDPAARDRFLAIMHVQAERMRRLIDDLMSLSRIELGEHIPPAAEVDLALAVIDVVDALGPLAEERGVVIESGLPALGEAVIIGDRDQVLQVIQNLAENALKYTPPGGVVRLTLETELEAAACAAPKAGDTAHLSLLTPDHATRRRYAALSVRDEGPGIARSFLPRLTERFYRVEGQKSGEHAGTGLGLAIVKHIVNRHRGGLTVESTEGRGASFTAYFPLLRRGDDG